MISTNDSKYKIIPLEDNIYKVSEETLNETLIIVHLHYEDFLNTAIAYIERVPPQIKVIITTSNSNLEARIKDFLLNHANCTYVTKENRGRDVSSFLVACRKEVCEHKYICFIHDKKEKNDYLKEDIHEWLMSQFENILGSNSLILNTIGLMERCQEIGLLLPPQTFSKNIAFAFSNNWGNNYYNTMSLLDKVGISYKINCEEAPMAIGTVFWCRTDALRQLFEYEWNYEDFPKEPLPDDGVISHAIERGLEFITKANGYKCYWCINSLYAERLLANYDEMLTESFKLLDDNMGLNLPGRIVEYSNYKERLSYKDSLGSIYIYGAGKTGIRCMKCLESLNVRIAGFVESKVQKARVAGFSVRGIEDISISRDDIFLIAMSTSFRKEVIEKLQGLGVQMNNIIIF